MSAEVEHSTSVDLIGETGSYGWSCACGRGSSAPLPLIVAEDLAGAHTKGIAYAATADVELLREAARVMRERADAATPGPWESKVGYPHIVWQPRGVGGEEFILSANLSERPDADAEHIASFASPAVALAVADWLLEASVDGGISETRCALAVARAYLGRQP